MKGSRSPWLRALGRLLLWAALLVLVARSVAGVVAPPEPAPVVIENTGTAEASWPDEQARAFAVGFARAYLTFDPARPEEHAHALTRYLPAGLDPHAGLVLPTEGSAQIVLAVTPADTVARGSTRGSVTVAVELVGGGLRHLAVPLRRDGRGGLAVEAYPSFVPPPPRANGESRAAAPPLPPSLRVEIEPLLARFFPAYLAGSGAELAYFLPAGGHLEAVGGQYADVGVESLLQEESRPGRFLALLADVRAQDQTTGAIHLLRYRVLLERRDRWYVAAVNTDSKGAR